MAVRAVYAETAILIGHTKPISAVKFSPNGKYLASSAGDKTIRLYDLDDVANSNSASDRSSVSGHSRSTPACKQVLSGHQHGVNDCAWSPDSRAIVSASDDRTCNAYDVQTGQTMFSLAGAASHTNYVFCVNFSPYGNLIATGSFDETIKMWDTRTARCVRTIPAHSEPITAVDFNQDGSLLMSSSFDGICRIWDVGMGLPIKALQAAEECSPISHARFSPNGKFALTSTLDNTLRLWNWNSTGSCTCVKTYKGHVNSKLCIFSAFSTTLAEKLVVSGSECGRIFLWDLQSKEIVQVLEGHSDSVLAVACHPSQSLIASGGHGQDLTVRLWKATLTPINTQISSHLDDLNTTPT